MGATVTTGRRASAFRSASGAIIYVLFEQTYEKNCFPHTPSWSCIAIGGIKDTLQRIFEIASDCEGGMLQNRSGQITPEGYLRSWMQCLSAPTEQRDLQIEFGFGSGRYGTFSEDRRNAVIAALNAHQRDEILSALHADNRFILKLHSDIDVLLVFHKELEMSAWRIITSASHDGAEFNAALGYNPKQAKNFPTEIPAALRIGDNDRLLQLPDGSWFCAGWSYSVVGSFIRNLWKEELSAPGSFKKRIGTYRQAVEYAPIATLEHLKVVVDTSIPVEGKYEQRCIAEVQSTYSTVPTPTGFEIIPTSDNLYYLTHLPHVCTRWMVSEDQRSSHSVGIAQSVPVPLTA